VRTRAVASGDTRSTTKGVRMGESGESELIDEGFFRRYRDLLDAEDAAFDELEHAYEEGDRMKFDADLSEWRALVERRAAFLERRGITPVRTG
jgi:hypothetical protein